MAFVAFILIVVAVLIIKRSTNKKWKAPSQPITSKQKKLLEANIPFYQNLNLAKKALFEFKVLEFIENVHITPIDTELEEKDIILLASSAIIPVFQFPHWQYIDLKEVLLYPKAFNQQFERDGDNNNRTIMGMVGTGYMKGKMILSKESLYHGFWNETDKQNTAIHEFVHLIDGTDGSIDGIPKVLMEKQYILPWLDLIQTKLIEIEKDKSDINDYALTNNAEFFAVAAEYFFERPELFKKKHPQIYQLMKKVFKVED